MINDDSWWLMMIKWVIAMIRWDLLAISIALQVDDSCMEI